MSSAASTPHGNTRYPELRDKASPGALTRQFGTPSRIAKHLGCSNSAVSQAMRRFGVKPRYFAADERMLAALGVRGGGNKGRGDSLFSKALFYLYFMNTFCLGHLKRGIFVLCFSI